MSAQKINNTFTKIYEELERFSKVVREQGQLENNIQTEGGDTAWLEDVRNCLADCQSKVQDAMMYCCPQEIEESHSNLKAAMTQALTEGVLDGDDEDGFMARSQLYFMAQDAIKLHGMIGDRDNLPSWVSGKITSAGENIQSVRRYMEYNTQIKGTEFGPGQTTESSFGDNSMADRQIKADMHQKKIAIDTVKNPNKSFMGGPTADEAEQMLRTKFRYSDEQIAKLKENLDNNELDRALHVALGGNEKDFVPLNDRPMSGESYELHIPARFQKAKSQVIDNFCSACDCSPDQVTVKLTRGSRTVKIDGQTPHPTVLSCLNSTLDRMDTGSIPGMYTEGHAMGDDEGASLEDIKGVITSRIMNDPDVLSKCIRASGPQELLDAIEQEAEFHVGADELGTSDISGMVNSVMRSLGCNESLDESSEVYNYTKTADELRKYASQDPEDMDYADFMDVANMLEKLTKANVMKQGDILAQLSKKIKEMDTVPRDMIYSMFKAHGIMESNPAKAKSYEYRNGKVYISKASFKKVHPDYKNSVKGQERMMVLDPKTQASVSAPVIFTEVSKKQADRLEANNEHGKLAYKLAQKFGTPQEVKAIEKINKAHNERGYIEPEEQSARDAIAKKYREMTEQKVEMCPEECCGMPVTECTCGPDCPHCDCYEKNKATNEGKSPHKKGTEKYKKHMAAKHASMAEANKKSFKELFAVVKDGEVHGTHSKLSSAKNQAFRIKGKIYKTKKQAEIGLMLPGDAEKYGFFEAVEFSNSSITADPKKIAQSMMKQAKSAAIKKAKK